MSPVYQLFTSEADFRRACDTVLARAESEILVFDHDLAALRCEEAPRSEALTRFLQRDGLPRIRMVLHDPGPLERSSPRLMQVVARFSHAITVRQSPPELRQLADTHLLADQCHGVRRFHVGQPRSALILDDPDYVRPWWQRFEELWDLSLPCLSIRTTGL